MSEKTLDKLIATLKSEAIEAAEIKAGEILEDARAQSQNILGDAEAERKEMLQSAQLEAEAILKKGRAALQQAARDLSVSVRNELLLLLKSVLKREVKDSFSSDIMENAILKVLENTGSGVTLKLPEKLEIELADKIQQRLKNSDDIASISADKNLIEGFKISHENQGWSYEITPEEVTEMMFAILSPQWIKLMKNESGK